MIYCLMFCGKPLTDEVREVLLINACDMAENGREKQKVKGRRYEGVITTDFAPASFVGSSIVVFEADIVCPKIGPVKVRYGVRTKELDERALAVGKWVTQKELMESEDYSLKDKEESLSWLEEMSNSEN